MITESATEFSLILVVFDPKDSYVRFGALQRLLEQIAVLRGIFELVVVNNNPLVAVPSLKKYLRECQASALPLSFTLLEPDENLGSARGFNLGFRGTNGKSPWVVYLCPDADVMDAAILEKMARILSQNARIGIAHPLCVYEDVRQFNISPKYSAKKFIRAVNGGRTMDYQEMSTPEANALLQRTGSREGYTGKRPSTPLTFAALRRAMLEEIGLFDEEIRLVCGENDDIAYRALLAGYDVVSLDSLFVGHRRLLFFHLNRMGEPVSMAHHHFAGRRDHGRWWTAKWGRPYRELYVRWRYGRVVASVLSPLFWSWRFWHALRQKTERAR